MSSSGTIVPKVVTTNLGVLKQRLIYAEVAETVTNNTSPPKD
jgi:hypothetical protein